MNKAIINKCKCCEKRRTLNKFLWLDNKTLLCYECADRIKRSGIFAKDGMKSAIKSTRICYRLQGVLATVMGGRK